MSNKLHISLLAAAISGVVCANAWALEPQSIKLADGLNFTPTLKVSESYDDNFREVENDEESSWITTIAPTFTLGAEGRKSAYKVSYSAVSDTFHSSHKDNNTDHHLTGDLGLEFDARNRLKLNAGYHDVEETAGLDQKVENDMYNTKNLVACTPTVPRAPARRSTSAPTTRRCATPTATTSTPTRSATPPRCAAPSTTASRRRPSSCWKAVTPTTTTSATTA